MDKEGGQEPSSLAQAQAEVRALSPQAIFFTQVSGTTQVLMPFAVSATEILPLVSLGHRDPVPQPEPLFQLLRFGSSQLRPAVHSLSIRDK